MKIGDIKIIALSDEGQEMTIREYFQKLMLTLWEEQDCFSGKRPFGNSGWDGDIKIGLIKSGVVRGKLDKHGYIVDVDSNAVDKIITQYLRNPELDV